jgi:hypothetical protein
MKRKLTWGLHNATVPLCLWLCWPVMGQDFGISGQVRDASRIAVATAVVTATSAESGSTRQVLSNAQGHFRLDRLPPGQYRIEAVKPGFKPLLRTGVGLGVGLTANVDLQMEEAEASETVILQARKTSTGSLLVYICGLSQGAGCEMLEPLPEPALSVTQFDPPLLP